MINNAGQPITGGKLVIDVSYFWFHVHSEDRDLCADTSCPINVGDFLVSHSQELPGITPPVSHLPSQHPEFVITRYTDFLWI